MAPGPEQGAKLGAPESIEHSKVDSATEEWKAKVGVESVVGPLGPESIVVSGAVPDAVE